MCLGHGWPGRVHLAPAGWLIASRELLQDLHVEPSERGVQRAGLTPMHRAILDLGDAIRGHRLSSVDLLSCRVGHGGESQDLLDWLQHFWGVRVRALRGDLLIVHERSPEGYYAFVDAPGPLDPTASAPRSQSRGRRTYVFAPPQDLTLFRTSSGGRPTVADHRRLPPAAP